MNYLYILLTLYLLSSCGNKKSEIVEEIKKAKNERAQAEINQGNYITAAKHLHQYNNAPASQQQIYKEAFEEDKKYLKNESPEILNNDKKLDSIALMWEWKARDARRKIDSLELELKKY